MLPGQLLDERYRLEAEVGSGGMGTVWRANDTRIERTVAVKVLHRHLGGDGEFRVRFEREARAVGSLQHRGVVGLYDFTETTIDGEPVAYLVMEYVAGQSLADMLRHREGLTVAKVMSILADTAEALQAAHDRGIVHRDVKPGNIIVNDDGVKIVDFGIAQAHGENGLTSTGLFMGSLQYVSPEQLQGHPPTAVSDVYSLGVVAYEALTGRPPFVSDTPAVVLSGHLHDEPAPLPPEVGEGVAAIVMRALAKNPRERFGSAAEFALACREGTVDTETTVPHAVPSATAMPATSRYPTAPGETKRRRAWPVAVAAAVVLVLAAGAAWWYFGMPGGPGGVNAMHALEQRGEPIAFPGMESDDLGEVPAPVTYDGVAYFAHPRDDGSSELTAVDMATGKRKWREVTYEPTGHALHAAEGLLYTADSERGVVNILDADTGESLKVIDHGTRVSVDVIANHVVVFADGSGEVTAYDGQGDEAWSESFDSAITDVDPVGKWKGFSAPSGRALEQDPSGIVVYTRDGTVWSLAPDGARRDSVSTGETGGVTASSSGMLFTATPGPGGGDYTLTARDITQDFEVVGRWEGLRPGMTPRKLVRCGEARICILDRQGDEPAGVVVIDFTKPGSAPVWESPDDRTIDDVFAAGDTTAVVEGNGDSQSSTRLYDANFEAVDKPSLGIYRPVDKHSFVVYPVTAGDAPANPVEEHFFTGLDARDGATADLGKQRVFPRCVAGEAAVACPTPEGITVWSYRGA